MGAANECNTDKKTAHASNLQQNARKPTEKKAGGRRLLHSLRFKMAVIVSVLVVALMAFDTAWNMHLQQQQAQNEALEKAQVLAHEMRATWDFIDMNQDIINRNEDGTFRSKVLVCAVAAKSVSMLFTTKTDYTIRFTSETPRQNANAPDEFESRAFTAFENDPGLVSYYGVERNEETGQDVFRYVEPLYVTETCLECHGDPVGEPDQYGYPKEGMQVGQIGGAMSITEPMDIYAMGIGISTMQQTLMVLIMVVVACLGMYFAASRIILKPLENLSHAAKLVGEGNFDYRLYVEQATSKSSDEITDFVHDFDKMACQLEKLYINLDTEVKEQTKKMKSLNDLLIYQKTELKKTLDRLSEESAYKNEFFAIVSHELRTPLTSILAYARLFQEDNSFDAKTKESIEEIESNGTLLLNLVNNILTISKAEAHKNELLAEPVDFVDLMGFVQKTLAPIAANKNVTLVMKADQDVPVTMADWEKLRRIVENLTDNAIKYTHRGGRVNASTHFDAKENAIVINVEDDGMGIAEEDLDDIFELYKQAGQSPQRRYRGTGLGLAVVKELAELHGGNVSVKSAVKKGSTFTVVIPYVAVDEEDDDEDYAR